MAHAASDEGKEADATPVSGAVLGKSNLSETELEQMIRKAAITNAALELLPEGLSSMAIIPLQMRMVYRIGKSYGYELDRDHTRDFIATLGVGLTSQYLEQFGRKLLAALWLAGWAPGPHAPADGKLRDELRDDLRARACRAALLRRWSPPRRCVAQVGVHGASRRGTRSRAALSSRHRTARAIDQPA